MNESIRMGLLNLHDAFLNASLQKKYMERCPVETNPNLFHISDRARFERSWVTFLYVLVEAWQSEQSRMVRDFVAKSTDITALNDILKKGKKDGFLSKMEQARHYMCHRDKREYWDEGRTSVLGNLSYHTELHDIFSNVLLITVRKLPEK